MAEGKHALYEQTILDHAKNPRNQRAMEDATHAVEGHNPLCGDHLTISVKLDGDLIEDISFEGRGCAISKASSSLLTILAKGKTKAEAQTMFDQFKQMVTADSDAPVDEEALGDLAAFSGIRAFPARVKCATLAWQALLAALDGRDADVSSE